MCCILVGEIRPLSLSRRFKSGSGERRLRVEFELQIDKVYYPAGGLSASQEER